MSGLHIMDDDGNMHEVTSTLEDDLANPAVADLLLTEIRLTLAKANRVRDDYDAGDLPGMGAESGEGMDTGGGR